MSTEQDKVTETASPAQFHTQRSAFGGENRTGFYRHISLHKPFKCRFCSKLFWTVGGRNSHEDSKHRKVFKYVCHICSKGYQGLYNYRGHMATHFAHLAEKCKKCGATFTYKGNMLRHERNCNASGPGDPLS